MDTDKMIEFLETDKLGVTFSDKGLKHLYLKNHKGEEIINLKNFDSDREEDPMISMLIKETMNFLETGSHNMIIDLRDFTKFQQRVFQATSKIKVGTICTYKDLAEIIGKAGAALAVGSAIGRNPVSYFIPTHRVLPKRGIGRCKNGAGFLREKLLIHEGQDIKKLRGNYTCNRNRCHLE